MLALASISTNAYAELVSDTHFSASAPTQYEDGTDIGSDDPLDYYLYCGESPGVYTVIFPMTQLFVNGGEDINVGLCVTKAGTYYFAATAFSTLYQEESVHSNEATKIYTDQDFVNVPMAPVLISVGP